MSSRRRAGSGHGGTYRHHRVIVTLRGGELVRGRFEDRSNTRLRIRDEQGEVISFKRKEVLNVVPVGLRATYEDRGKDVKKS